MNEYDMTSGSLSDESRNFIQDRYFFKYDIRFRIWFRIFTNMDISKLLNGFVKVIFALCQKKVSLSLIKISKFVEASAMN